MSLFRTLYIEGERKLDFAGWCGAIQAAAGSGGDTLSQQQLTETDIPVIVHSCIGYITQCGERDAEMYTDSDTNAYKESQHHRSLYTQSTRLWCFLSSLCVCVSSCDNNSRSSGSARDQRTAIQQNNSVPPPLLPLLPPCCSSFPLFCILFFFHPSSFFVFLPPPPADLPSFTLTNFLSPFCQPLFSPFDISLPFPPLTPTFPSIYWLHLCFHIIGSVYRAVCVWERLHYADILYFPVGNVNPSGQPSGKPGQFSPSCTGSGHLPWHNIWCNHPLFCDQALSFSNLLTKYNDFFWTFFCTGTVPWPGISGPNKCLKSVIRKLHCNRVSLEKCNTLVWNRLLIVAQCCQKRLTEEQTKRKQAKVEVFLMTRSPLVDIICTESIEQHFTPTTL